MDDRHHYSSTAQTVEHNNAQMILKKDVWLQVIKSYKDHKTDGCNLKFSDDVTGWAGKPESGQLSDGIDISQVTKFTTSEAFENNVHQSVSNTLFAYTPQQIRHHCLKAVQEGLASTAISVYFWKTSSTSNNNVFGIRCSSCLYAVHGTWTNKSFKEPVDKLSRLCCAFVLPTALGIDNLPQLPLQH